MVKKILVIEDEYQFIQAYKIVFEKEGYLVLVENNGLKGLKTAKAENPDVILLDLVMPEMDGYTFLEKIKEIPEISKIPIFVMSSLPRVAVESGIPADLVKGILGKADYTPKKVLEVIKKYL